MGRSLRDLSSLLDTPLPSLTVSGLLNSLPPLVSFAIINCLLCQMKPKAQHKSTNITTTTPVMTISALRLSSTPFDAFGTFDMARIGGVLVCGMYCSTKPKLRSKLCIQVTILFSLLNRSNLRNRYNSNSQPMLACLTHRTCGGYVQSCKARSCK